MLKVDDCFGGWEVELVQFLTTDDLNFSMALILLSSLPRVAVSHIRICADEYKATFLILRSTWAVKVIKMKREQSSGYSGRMKFS